MPLQKQVVSIGFAQGVDTKTDDFGVAAGKLLTLENGTFISPKRIQKRNGYGVISSAIVNPPTTATSITTGQALAAYGGELLLADKTSLYSYDVANSSWVYKTGLVSTNITQSQVIRNSATQVQQDSALHSSGLMCAAWEDSRGGVRYSIIDTNTGQVIVADKRVATNEIKPRVLVIGNYFLLLWVNTSVSQVYGATIPIVAPTTAITGTTLTSGGGNNQLKSTAPNYDAAVISTTAGQQLYLAYNNSTGGGGITAVYSTANTPLTTSTAVSIATEAATVITVFADTYRRGPVIAYYNGTAVKFKAYDYTLTTLFAGNTVETIANVVSITGVSTSSTAIAWKLFYSTSAASTYNYLTRVAGVTQIFGNVGQLMFPSPLITSTGDIISTAPAVLLRSAALCGKAFTYAGNAYVPLAFQTSLQSSYFIADATGKLVAKMLYGLGGGIPARTDGKGSAMLTSTNAKTDGTTFQLACLITDLLTTQGSAGGGTAVEVYTQTGVASMMLDFFDAANSYLRAELGRNLHLSGGFLQMYDGSNVVEHGFHLFPENVTVPGAVTNHTYQYVVCYEWCDGQGQLHRSAPSPAVTLQQANPIDGSHTVAVTIPTLRLTAKSDVVCVVYRTIDNGTVFYRASSATAPTANSTSADTVTFTDAVTDAVLLGSPQLYTTGGVIENIAPPPVGHVLQHRNRLMALDTTSGQWWYSKEVVPGSPVEFTDSFVMAIDPRGGASTAGASLDDKFIIFKPTSIYFVSGRGPESTGTNNDFSDAILVTSDCGCVNPRSIVIVPRGIMFQSEKGIYLLDRSLAVSYVGAEVEAYNSATVTSAQLIANTNQVRFTLSSGVALVFDYLMEQWSVFTAINAVDSCIFQGLFTYVTPLGATYQETPGSYSDAGNWIKLKVATSWLQFAGVQGFQRIYRGIILGHNQSAHTLHVQVAYDFNPGALQEDYMSPTAPTAYGDGIYAGPTDTAIYGGAPPAFQWRVHLAQQKCEAVQFTIEDLQTGTSIGEGISLSGLTLEMGVKKGAIKLPAASSVG